MLSKPRFKHSVTLVLGPALSPHGFTYEREQRGVVFRRTLRGFPNAIVLDTDDMGSPRAKRVRFTLYAPKAPLGWPSNGLPGGQFWWTYQTQEDLMVQLEKMRELLVREGLPWLEVNTPGNVPSWEEVVNQHITPWMTSFGFVIRKERYDAADTLCYTMVADPQSRVFLDFRKPGTVSCALSRYRTPDSPLESKVGPTLAYQDEVDFAAAVEQLRDWLVVHIPLWFWGEEPESRQ